MLVGVVGLWLLVAPAGAQPAGDEVLGQKLPAPDVDEDAAPAAFLRAARAALDAARYDEAMEALERAESRALIRSVKPSLAGIPSDQKIVRDIQAARRALGAGDRAGCLAAIAAALADPDQ
jgi:hypothetical protein